MELPQESTDGLVKKSPFDDLSRDELIQKCKGLLVIAQKAKHAKNELLNDIESYKIQFDKYEKEKKCSLENLKTLQELVDSLTEQKLNYITEVDSAQSKIKVLTNKCKTYDEELKQYKSELITQEKLIAESAQKLSDFDNEIISLKRQNNRLIEENDQLISQLSELEAQTVQVNNIGLEQRQQLQMLEDKVQSDEANKIEIDKYNKKIEELEKQLSKQNDYHLISTEYENKIIELTNLYESEKNKKEKANIKLRIYKDKILKCAACITQLKNSRFILTKTVREYSDNIPKWQNDIIKASKVLDDQINELNDENKMLKEKLNDLLKSENSDEGHLKIVNLNSENDLLKAKINELEHFNKLEVENSKQNQFEIIRLKDECKLMQSQLLDAHEQISKLSEEKYGLNKEISDLRVKHEEFNLLKSENTNANMSQVTKLSEENEALKQMITELELHKKRDNEDHSLKLRKLHDHCELLQSQLLDAQGVTFKLSEENNTISKELENLSSKYTDLNNLQLTQVQIINQLNTELNDIKQSSDILKSKNKELTKSVEQLKLNNEKLSLSAISPNDELIDNLTLQIKALESEKAILVKEKLNARDNILDLESKNKILSDQVSKLKLEIQTTKAQLDSITLEKDTSEKRLKLEKKDEFNNMKCEIIALQEQYDLLKKEHDNLQDLNGLLKEEVETLKLSLEQPRPDDSENLSDLNVSLQADIVKLETKLSAYKQENSSLLAEIKESRAKVKEFDSLASECEDAKTKLTGYKTENAELLNEMKEINQVLKERGESISKLQKAVGEMERLIESLERDRDNANHEKNEMQKKVANLESELKNAELCTSKNNKVTEQILSEKESTSKASIEKDNIIISLKEELEKVKQQQPPLAELPSEDMSTSTISRAEEHSRMRDLDDTFEEKYTKLRMFALKLKKKLNETISQLKNAEQDKAKLEKLLNEKKPVTTSFDETDSCNVSEISDLREKINSLSESIAASKNIEVELDKLKGELELKTQQLTSEIEAHKITKENLEKARRDAKKKNVLSLEMEDYERSMKELTAKMEEKKKKMVQMESIIDTQEGTITAMKTQIKLLEEQIRSEETQNRLTKEELQHTLEIVKDKDNIIQTKNGIISKLEQNFEDEKRKNEEADMEMTGVLSVKEKQIITLGEEKIELNNKLKRLEFKCAELNESLRFTNIELADLKTEYTSYKVRAQAVLRQNQTVDHSQEEQLKEEAAALRAQIETLTGKLATAQEQCAELNAEMETARRRATESSNEVARAQQRTGRLQADLTRLSQQLESERSQHKLQVSTLTQCYKTQISELEAKHQKETDLLRKQLVVAQENATTAASANRLNEVNRNQYMLPVIPKDDASDGEMDINVSMIPREEGEGSESAPSPPPSNLYPTGGGSSRSPVPLERLLEEGVPDDEALDTSSLALTPEQEIGDLKRRLQAQQQRVKHVTVLLSESERECARMSQLSELLKTELRRVHGTTQNAHNAEYMKNVTLKFLTLPPGDERSRLVPVLQKILTLTPEETGKVQAVAKGLDPNPNKGWGSYLPWPGGK